MDEKLINTNCEGDSRDVACSAPIRWLLYESKVIFKDQLAALEVDSKNFGTRGDDLEFSLLVAGLAAERGWNPIF